MESDAGYHERLGAVIVIALLVALLIAALVAVVFGPTMGFSPEEARTSARSFSARQTGSRIDHRTLVTADRVGAAP
jgi:type II secretory pathway pseudopilin PulG